jgi:hypothetical protein
MAFHNYLFFLCLYFREAESELATHIDFRSVQIQKDSIEISLVSLRPLFLCVSKVLFPAS